jgi:glutaredoxin
MIEIVSELPEPSEGQRRLFLKAGCPFCTKLVVFLAAAGIQDKVKPIYDCPPVREYVAAVNSGKCSFPAMEIEEGKVVMLETSDIIDFLSKEYDVAQEPLWAARYFDEGMFVVFSALFGYLIKHEGGYAKAKKWFAENAQMVPHPCPPEGAAEVL